MTSLDNFTASPNRALQHSKPYQGNNTAGGLIIMADRYKGPHAVGRQPWQDAICSRKATASAVPVGRGCCSRGCCSHMVMSMTGGQVNVVLCTAGRSGGGRGAVGGHGTILREVQGQSRFPPHTRFPRHTHTRFVCHRLTQAHTGVSQTALLRPCESPNLRCADLAVCRPSAWLSALIFDA